MQTVIVISTLGKEQAAAYRFAVSLLDSSAEGGATFVRLDFALPIALLSILDTTSPKK